MLILGLTGGIASGKSTISSYLKDRMPIIDADLIAKEIVEPHQRAYKEIIAYFGEDILLPNKCLDRQKLGQIIFTNEEARHKLNQITHPKLNRLMKRNAMDEKQALERINSQWSLEEKCKLADIVIDNNQSIQESFHQMDQFIESKLTWFQYIQSKVTSGLGLCILGLLLKYKYF